MKRFMKRLILFCCLFKLKISDGIWYGGPRVVKAGYCPHCGELWTDYMLGDSCACGSLWVFATDVLDFCGNTYSKWGK